MSGINRRRTVAHQLNIHRGTVLSGRNGAGSRVLRHASSHVSWVHSAVRTGRAQLFAQTLVTGPSCLDCGPERCESGRIGLTANELR